MLVNSNRIVSTDTLSEELWRENPPRSATTTLQTYIFQIRKLMGSRSSSRNDSRNHLVTTQNGYMMQVRPNELDLFVFEDLAIAGETALRAGEPEKAARLLSDALALWKGRALIDVTCGPHLDVHTVRLDERRMAVTEQRITADLLIGRHREIVVELTALTAEQPYHEYLHIQLMMALYASLRKSDALEVYHRLRRRLLDDLGIEPSPALHAMQQAILSDDPMLMSRDGGVIGSRLLNSFVLANTGQAI
nr:SARP transcriptional regulator [Actinoallomurus sp.]